MQTPKCTGKFTTRWGARWQRSTRPHLHKRRPCDLSCTYIVIFQLLPTVVIIISMDFGIWNSSPNIFNEEYNYNSLLWEKLVGCTISQETYPAGSICQVQSGVPSGSGQEPRVDPVDRLLFRMFQVASRLNHHESPIRRLFAVAFHGIPTVFLMDESPDRWCSAVSSTSAK